jgi:hypothetical protein
MAVSTLGVLSIPAKPQTFSPKSSDAGAEDYASLTITNTPLAVLFITSSDIPILTLTSELTAQITITGDEL